MTITPTPDSPTCATPEPHPALQALVSEMIAARDRRPSNLPEPDLMGTARHLLAAEGRP